MTRPAPARPTRPVAVKPAGYVGLASYSSLSRLWQLIAGAERAGREVSVVRGDSPEVARRRVAGYELTGAGLFVDPAPLLGELQDAFAPHPALVAMLAGDVTPLRELLGEAYTLRLDFVVALTARRDLIARPEFRYLPLPGTEPPLPAGLPLRPRRLGRDELNLLLLRACGLA